MTASHDIDLPNVMLQSADGGEFSFGALDPVGVLARAREIVAEGWCQDYLVLDSEGLYTARDLFDHYPGEDRFSMLGACRFALYDCAPEDVQFAIWQGPGDGISCEDDFAAAEDIVVCALWDGIRQLHSRSYLAKYQRYVERRNGGDKYQRCVSEYNDDDYRLHEDVLDVFDLAIAMMAGRRGHV